MTNWGMMALALRRVLEKRAGREDGAMILDEYLEKYGVKKDRYRGLKVDVHHPQDEHGKVHVHIGYGKHRIKADIDEEGKIIGKLPKIKMRHAKEWLEKNRDTVVIPWNPKRGGKK